jgi:hypothetical protein
MAVAMNDRKKPGVAFWATVVVVVGLALYLLSFGPASRLAARHQLPLDDYGTMYRPLILLTFYGPRRVGEAIWGWTKLWGAHTVLEDAF